MELIVTIKKKGKLPKRIFIRYEVTMSYEGLKHIESQKKIFAITSILQMELDSLV